MITQLMDVNRVAEILGIHPQSVRRLTRDGKLPCVRISRKVVRYSMEHIETFVRSQTTNTESLRAS